MFAKTVFMSLDKLGMKSNNLKVHRWRSKHESNKPFKINVSHEHDNKKHDASFETCLTPDRARIKNKCFKVSQSEEAASTGVGTDRQNNNTLKNLNNVELLGFKLATADYSPGRVK